MTKKLVIIKSGDRGIETKTIIAGSGDEVAAKLIDPTVVILTANEYNLLAAKLSPFSLNDIMQGKSHRIAARGILFNGALRKLNPNVIIY